MTEHSTEQTYASETNDRENSSGLKRQIAWADAFWIVSGVSTLVLFSIGSIAAYGQKPLKKI